MKVLGSFVDCVCERHLYKEDIGDIKTKLISRLPAINEQIQNIAQKKDTLCRRMYN